MHFTTVLSAAALVAGASAAVIDTRATASTSLHGPYGLNVHVTGDETNMQPFDDKQMSVGSSSLNPTDKPTPLLPTTADFIFNKPVQTFYFDDAGRLVYKTGSTVNSAVLGSDGTLFFGTDSQITAAKSAKDLKFKWNKTTGAVTHGSDKIWACNYVVNDWAPKDKPDNTRLVRQSGWPYIAIAAKKPTNEGSSCFPATFKLVAPKKV